MRRREFLGVMGGAAVAWPVVASAQQPAMPTIGFLDSRSPETLTDRLRVFRQSLKDNGYLEGDNVTIVYRWAENHLDLVPELAADLIRRQVAVVIASGGLPVVFAAKAATATVPIVGIFAEDPVGLGLVTSLARPDGNVTGINILNAELVAKQLALLRELVPRTARIAVLVNPNNPTSTESTLRDAEQAARSMGMQIQVLRASSDVEIDAAFATLESRRPDALFVHQDPFFGSRRVQLVQLITYHRLPAIYTLRDFPEVGGLMSYGSNIVDAYRQIGIYAARILKGTKVADLPVVQSTKLELVINTQIARMFGLTIPPTLLARADEVIE
jgi:putative ABC transport system substrate-binding protein